MKKFKAGFAALGFVATTAVSVAYTAELDVASLNRDIQIGQKYLNKENGINLITDRYKEHIENLKDRPEWTKKYEYKESIGTAILSELCRALNSINVYKKSARYNTNASILEFFEGEGFKALNDYDASNWNYVVLMNALNYMVNDGGFISDAGIDAVTTKIINTVKNDKPEYSTYAEMITNAGDDIKAYMNDLKLYDFIKGMIRCNFNEINELNKEEFKNRYIEDKQSLLPSGIYNECATCYLNASIQMLYNYEPFREAVSDLSKNKNNEVAIQVNEIFDQMSFKKKGKQEYITVTAQKEALWKLLELNWTQSEQKDASEFLTYLLDKLVDEPIKDELAQISKDYSEGKLSDAEKCEKQAALRRTTRIGRLIKMDYETVTKCTNCGKRSSRRDPCTQVTLDIPATSLEENLDKYEATGKLDEYTCDRCCKKAQTTKQVRIGNVPELLIIHLKRFANPEEKDEKLVECPEILAIAGNKYKLRAAVIHSGTMDYGHYWTEAYASDGTAYKANDRSVTKLPSINPSSAYVLMYERVR